MSRAVLGSFCFAWLVLVLAPLQRAITEETKSEEANEQDLTAEQILKRMFERYAKAKTYRDTGKVTDVIIGPDGKQVIKGTFTTAFVRPDRFRLEYLLHLPDRDLGPFIVWLQKKSVKFQQPSSPDHRDPETLDRAVDLSAGVTQQTSRNVPKMLMPDAIRRNQFEDYPVSGRKKLADDKIGKTDCYQIQYTHDYDTFTIWIEKKTFLLRKIHNRLLPGFGSSRDRTVTHEPIMDAEVPDKLLELNSTK